MVIWDGQTVQNAFGATADLTIAKRLANREPDNWQLSGPVNSWAEQLANEILPLAHEAQSRLEFSRIKIAPGSVPGKDDIKSGRASETKKVHGQFYADWAPATVKKEIHKGAALLEQIL